MSFRVKHKEHGHVSMALRLNPAAISPMEAIFLAEDGEMWSDYVKDYDPVDPNLTHQDLVDYLLREERLRIG